MTRKADFNIGIGTIIFAILIFISANGMPTPEDGLGAGGFPKFIAIGLIIMGVLLVIRSAIAIKAGEKNDPKVTLAELLNVGKIILTFALYLFVIRYIGFLIATPIFFAICMYLYGERNKKKIIIISIVIAIVFYLTFEKGFQVILPQNRLF